MRKDRGQHPAAGPEGGGSHAYTHGGVQFSKFTLICPISPTKTQILVFNVQLYIMQHNFLMRL